MSRAYMAESTPNKQAALLIEYSQTNGFYSPKINYTEIVREANRANAEFGLDIILIYAIAAVESQFRTNAVNTNYYTNRAGEVKTSIDMGLMQVNTCWSDTLFDGGMLSNNIMFQPYTAIYAGCYVLRGRIRAAKGNIREAVRRYNGAGKRAEEYADRIMRTYYEMCRMYHR